MEQSKTGDRTLHLVSILDAPVAKVWDAWTSAALLEQWWAPQGFTTTVHQMLVKEGEEWRLTIHGPDGKNYPNKSIFGEVVPHKKFVYNHFNPKFIGTALFEDNGEQTKLEWSMQFETPEMYETVVKTFKADEGQKQNVEKLQHFLSMK